MSNNRINRFVLFSNGIIDTTNNIIEICDTKNKQDYETMTELLKRHFK